MRRIRPVGGGQAAAILGPGMHPTACSGPGGLATGTLLVSFLRKPFQRIAT